MSPTRLAPLTLLLLAPLIAAGGACALGEEEEPGCRGDAHCDDGFVCRGGACFRITTGPSPPLDLDEDDAGNASDASDAAESQLDSG